MNRGILAATACAVASLVVAPTASAIDKVGTKKLRNKVTVGAVLGHERAFQRIADENGGNRAATEPGYDASVDYAVKRFKKAGYKVKLDGFDFPDFELLAPTQLSQTAPTQRAWTEGADFITAQYSGPGEVTGQVVPTSDIQTPPPDGPGSGTSGCEPSDYPAATAGNVALIQRGTCTFTEKYDAAKAAGAAAVLIFNDGGEDREEPLETTSTAFIGIPTLMVSNDVGEALLADAKAGTATVHIVSNTSTTPNTEYNVIADSKSGDKDRTIVVGGHLDSVEKGPGINDNGSGSATILTVAEQMSKLKRKPRNRVRFALWGAEEAGLVGSTAYVDELAEQGKLGQVEANLNFDMLGSPNFARLVYDGDNSTGDGEVGPRGSDTIEKLFVSYFDSKGLPTQPTAFDGRSDYGEFIANGVPAGGLFSGAEEEKTPEQAELFGGTAGEPLDPCYHEACDDIMNLSRTSLDQMSDAVAHATWTLARSKSPITVFRNKKAKKGKNGKRMNRRADLRVR